MTSPNFPQPEEDVPSISFNAEDVEFELDNAESIENWLKKIIEQEDKKLLLLNFIFCSDKYLHQLNVDYLSHDTLTDVITFHYEEPPMINGEIFISIDRVKENASTFNVTFLHELYRVMAHGTLHLCGYGDKAEEEIRLMRKKENEALGLFLLKED